MAGMCSWVVVVVMVVVMVMEMKVVMVVQAAGVSESSHALISGTGKEKEGEEEWKKQARVGAAFSNPLLFKFPRAPHLIVVAESWPPHVKVTPGRGGAATTAEGPMASFLEALAASLNFTYSIVQGDGYWGAPTENGTWNGMIGMVMRKDADLGLGPFGVSHARSKVVGFTMPIFREVLHVLTARPRPQPQPWGFLAPFKLDVWLALLSCMLVVTVIAAAAGKVLMREENDHSSSSSSSSSSSFFSHLLSHYQLFLGQSTPLEVVGLTPRFVFWLWLMTVLVMMRTYGGSLTSLLAVKTVEVKYDSLKDVLGDPSLTLILEGSTALTGHLQKATDGVFEELAAAVRTRGRQVRASEMQVTARTSLQDGRHAMFLEKIGCNNLFSDHFSSTGRCDFYRSRGVFWPLLYSLVLPLKSPLLPLIDARILAIREYGVYEEWAKAMTPNLTHCLSMPTKLKFQEPYSLQHLWAVFLLVGAGIVAAAGIFVMELMIRKI